VPKTRHDFLFCQHRTGFYLKYHPMYILNTSPEEQRPTNTSSRAGARLLTKPETNV